MKFLNFFFYFLLSASCFGKEGLPLKPEAAPAPLPSANERPADIFHKALKVLQEEKPGEARVLFLEFLKLKPSSRAGRFNLALSYWKDGEKALTRAYLRQLLFEDPYDRAVRSFLEKTGDKKFFWLWWPPDGVLVLMALSGALLVYILFRKKFSFLYGVLAVFLLAQGFGIWYFHYRLSDYGTLIKASAVFSAPDPKSAVLFHKKAGGLLKLSARKNNLPEWRFVKAPFSEQKGWLKSDSLKALKRAP